MSSLRSKAQQANKAKAKPAKAKVSAAPSSPSKMDPIKALPELKVMALADLSPATYNPRTISPEAMAGLRKSLQRFGALQPIVWNCRTGNIVGGHQRRDAMMDLGIKEAHVIVVDVDEVEEKAMNVALNSRHIAGDYEEAKLGAILGEIRALAPDVFEEVRFEALADEYEIKLEDGPITAGSGEGMRIGEDPDPGAPEDEEAGGAAEETPPEVDAGLDDPEDEQGAALAMRLREKWGTDLGQVWEIPSKKGSGVHRLVIGDSTNKDTIDRLLTGDQVSLVACDPPYAIYGSSSGIASDIADDVMVRPFFRNILSICYDRLPWFGHAYVACDWRSWAAWWDAAKSCGLAVKNMLVWDKGGQGMGSNYANCYEIWGFFSKLPPQTAMGDRATGQRVVHRPNILRYSRATGKERLHNAAKPIPLMVELITNSSDAGQVVLDPFCGSGTTTVACEEIGRLGRTSEINPNNASLLLERLSQRGLEPKKVAW